VAALEPAGSSSKAPKNVVVRSRPAAASGSSSPRLEQNIGYAMVPIEFAELGTELAVETPDERTSAIVVRKPFIDPRKEIPSSTSRPPSMTTRPGLISSSLAIPARPAAAWSSGAAALRNRSRVPCAGAAVLKRVEGWAGRGSAG
jgi:hypothetical protein